MSIWSGMKRAFGFSQEHEEEEEEYASGLPVYAVNRPPVPVTPSPEVPSPKPAPAKPGAEETPASDTTPPPMPPAVREKDTSLPDDIFDAIIELFNKQQPDFVKSCLNLESQRKYLITSIDDKLRSRVISAMADEDDNARARNAALQRRLSSLEEENKGVEKLRSDNNKLKLSLERQKRALLDRINDLEAQVAKLNTEKERFYIDKRNPADAEAIANGLKRIEELEAEVSGLNDRLKAEEGNNTPAAGSATEPAAAPTAPDTTESEETTALRSRVAELEEELKRQSTLREQLEIKSRMGDEMVSATRNDAATLRKELEQANADKEEALQLIRQQIEGSEQLKARLQGKINDLQEQLKAEKREEREARIAALTEENASLRHTIENNLYNQANSEMKLRREIKELRSRLEALPAAGTSDTDTSQTEPTLPATTNPGDTPKPAAPRRRGRPKKARIDTELDNTEWFAQGKKDDPDFGYHEPPRRPVNDNEAQLSLF